ncbi:hypothetical protein [Methylobacter sp. S3L5C]|uniref:hypothetical protein n=1 Tax=Methylobacter sp. S3L5C TaxID=2839024 RepID=UPI001FACFA1E|nr:hypothetical protein [Methylobacter sp. S3L5C]UOA09395.1 hypothetical protein KKZ03_03545 [Methylobacter sp. S3L5C]
MKFFIGIIVFLLVLFIFLTTSVGVAFGLVLIFPVISFEIGILIGAISITVSCYGFIGIINTLSNIYSLPTEEDILDKIDLGHVVLPRSTRSRRKRR